MTKRKASDGAKEILSNRKKTKTKETGTIRPVPVPKAPASKRAPKTLKEKILAVVASQDTLVGLATIKKVLAEQYDFESSTANNNKINKTLKTMSEEHRDDFGKIGGSYHGGANSAAFLAHEGKVAAEQALIDEYKAHEGEVQCPFCFVYSDEEIYGRGEDSVARGGRFQCSGCNKTFFTWISDHFTTRLGHKKEYKFSGLY